MKKLLLITFACIFSSLCLADDFNWQVMKNPPADIKSHWSNAGNTSWTPKNFKTYFFEKYNMTIFLTTRILLKNGKTTIQIIFANDKAKIDKLGFTYKSDNKMFEIPIVKNNIIKKNGKLFYQAIGEILHSEYIKRFILSYPEFVYFRAPTLIKSPKVSMNGIQCYEWEAAFTTMKPLFNIKSEQFAYVLQLPITDDAVCMELWNNQPGTVSKWGIITQSGKRWDLGGKEQITNIVNGTTVYIAQYFFPKAWYLDNLIFDPIVSMEFSVTNKGGTQDYTFALTENDKAFISSINASLTSSSHPQNVQTTTTQTAPPADVIKFMGIPLWGDIETFAKQLEAKGWQFKRKDSQKREKHGLYNEVWHFENGRFWEFSRCDLWVHVLFNSRLVCSVTVYTTYSLESQVSELLGALKTTYGEFAKDYTAYNDRWERQIGKNHITVFKSTKRIGYTNFPALCITYANHLSNENEKIKKAYNDEVNRRYKIEAEQKRARANQDL